VLSLAYKYEHNRTRRRRKKKRQNQQKGRNPETGERRHWKHIQGSREPARKNPEEFTKNRGTNEKEQKNRGRTRGRHRSIQRNRSRALAGHPSRLHLLNQRASQANKHGEEPENKKEKTRGRESKKEAGQSATARLRFQKTR